MLFRSIPGDNTFANYQEANRTFWRQTVLPLVARTCEALSTWLSPAYGDTLTLRADTDSLDALSSEREALWTRLDKASFLTTDEKRAAVGYGPMPLDTTPLDQVSLDQVSATKFNPHHAADGRFDFSPERAQPIAGKPTPPKQPAPAKPIAPAPKPIDPPPTNPGAYGKTPGGQEYSNHGEKQNNARGFTGDRIDAIIANNRATRVGKVNAKGQKTWEYSDSRGNKVVTNERGGVVTVFSPSPGGLYIPKP